MTIDHYRVHLQNHIHAVNSVSELSDDVGKISKLIISSFKNSGKLLLCGNGGSASDAQHIAAEFTGRFITDRKPLPAIALTTDCSALTCIPNDYSFDEVFSRQVAALGSSGDILIAISTSGNSHNIVSAVDTAHSIGMQTVGLLGKDGGKLKGRCTHELIVGSDITAHIQEVHILLLHALTWYIDREFCE